MWTVVIVVVLPLSQLLVEQVDVIRDAVPVEELVELLVVDAVRPFDFAVQVRRPGLDVGVTDVEALQVPVELRLELGAVIGLHDVDPKRQTPPHVVDESDRHALVARVVNLEDANPSAIIDRGELVQPLARPRNALDEELHVQLQSVAGERFLVALPAFPVWLVLLVGRQPVQPMSAQNAVHGRPHHADLMKSLQIVGDLARAEMVGLAQVQDLADHGGRRCARGTTRRARPVVQPGRAKFVEAPFPLIKRLAGNAEMATGSRHTSGRFARSLQYFPPPRPQPRLFCLRHRVSVVDSTNEDAVDAAVPVDAQNAPTGTWKLQNSFHSANSAHPLSKDLNPNRRELELSTVSRDFTKSIKSVVGGV